MAIAFNYDDRFLLDNSIKDTPILSYIYVPELN